MSPAPSATELRRVGHERGKDRHTDHLDTTYPVRLSDAGTDFPLGRLHELSGLFLLSCFSLQGHRDLLIIEAVFQMFAFMIAVFVQSPFSLPIRQQHQDTYKNLSSRTFVLKFA